MNQPPMLAADYIRELVRPYTTTVTIHRTTRDNNGRALTTRETHTVHHPSLINQLDEATTSNSHLSDSDAARGIATSKPTAHLEAIDTLNRITKQSKALAADLGIDPIPGRLTDRLEAIAGKLGTDHHPKPRSWWASARLVTQHDSPAIRPYGVPCPECGESGSLRIRLEDDLASCTDCHTVWDRTGHPDHGSLDVLGQHVRWCLDHDINKARHWITTDDGDTTECTACLVFRIQLDEFRRFQRGEVDKTTQHTA